MKIRKKRDFSADEKVIKKREFGDAFSPYGIDNAEYAAYYDASTLLGRPTSHNAHSAQHRGVGAPNVFPDPLFKEQWYLVSSNLI